MPDRCCVPQCSSNSDKSKPYVSVFKFPRDEAKREQWCRAIPRKDWSPSDRSVVCAKHFRDCDVMKIDQITDRNGKRIQAPRKCPRLKESAYPCIFEKGSDCLPEIEPSKNVTFVKLDDLAILEIFLDGDKEKDLSENEPVLEFVGFDALESNSPSNDSPPTPPELINPQTIKQEEVTEQTEQNLKEGNKLKIPSKRKQPAVTELQESLDQASTASRNDDEDECDLYGKLIAKKLRKLPESQRERLMYEIQGLFVKCSQYGLRT